jgi:mRNA interferase RelE/StbE
LGWTVELSSGAERQLRKLDPDTARRLGNYLRTLVAETTDPRVRGKALTGPMTGLWRYRVGDYRLVCELIDQRLVVLVVRLGHRSRIYD